MCSSAGTGDNKPMISKLRPTEKHDISCTGNLVPPRRIRHSDPAATILPSFRESFRQFLPNSIAWSTPATPSISCSFLEHEKEAHSVLLYRPNTCIVGQATPATSCSCLDLEKRAHSLFVYCPHTFRIGPLTHSSAIREIIWKWRKDNACVSLREVIELRSKRDSNHELYMWAEKVRPSKSVAAHPTSERNRRLMHKDCFAETDLRVPDFIMALARANKEELTMRYMDPTKSNTTNPRGSKNLKTGKEELHLAILLLLDFDVMVMDELMQERQKEEQKRQELEQRIRQYEAVHGPLDDAVSTVMANLPRPSTEPECPTHLTCTSARASSLKIFCPATGLNSPKVVRRAASDMDNDDDDNYSSNASPSKRPRHSLHKSLPSPTPSCAESCGDVSRSQGLSNASSRIGSGD